MSEKPTKHNKLIHKIHTTEFFPMISIILTLRKIPKFHLMSWCGNFAERHSFRRVLGESTETVSFHKIFTPEN